jgi:hypothetical protein
MRQATPPAAAAAVGRGALAAGLGGGDDAGQRGLVIQGLMLLVCYAVDRRLYPQHGAALADLLRFRLSAVAALSCFIGAAGT